MRNRYDNMILLIERWCSQHYCLDSEYGGKDDVDEECESTCSERGRTGGLLGGCSHRMGRDVMLGVTGRDEFGVFA